MNRSLHDITTDALALAGRAEDSRYTPRLLLLSQRAYRPEAFVVVVGETSTGKSTLINALLGSRILPAAAGPSTGTVTQVVCRGTKTDRRLAIYKDGAQAELDASSFDVLSERPTPDLLRLQLHTDRAGPDFRGLNVIDTPGYNALVAEHEEILRGFLPESDAVVFVAGYRTGFGQADQDLYEVAGQSTSGDPDIPMFLVVNRAPDAVRLDDKRVVEIAANANDSLRRKPEVVLVRSAAPVAAGAGQALPDVLALWQRVSAAARSEARQLAVRAKLAAALRETCENLLGNITTCLDADAADSEDVAEQLAILRDGRQRSLAVVQRYVARLRTSLPGVVRHERGRITAEVAKIVDDAGKWLGQPECTAFVVEHTLPFEGRKACTAIGDAIAAALEELDRELEEIANTTINKLRQRVRPSNDVASRMATDLVRTLAKRAGGAAALAILAAKGGVGGSAAGAGNLVKMALKRLGNLFDKTFSREVYTQIGRLFNKKTIEMLGGAAAVGVEAALFAWDAHHWRGQLKDRVGKAIDGWETAVLKELTVSPLTLSDARRPSPDRGSWWQGGAPRRVWRSSGGPSLKPPLKLHPGPYRIPRLRPLGHAL